MKKMIGQLSYNDGIGKFEFVINDISYGSIGEGKEIEIWYKERWVKDQMTYIDDWKLLYSHLEGAELEGLKVRI